MSELPLVALGVPVSRADGTVGVAGCVAAGVFDALGDSPLRSGNEIGEVVGDAIPGGCIVELGAAGLLGGLGAGVPEVADGGVAGAKDSASDHGSGRMVAKTFR